MTIFDEEIYHGHHCHDMNRHRHYVDLESKRFAFILLTDKLNNLLRKPPPRPPENPPLESPQPPRPLELKP